MKKNILIMMSDNRLMNNDFNICDYNTLTSYINYQYSKIHKYEFMYLNPNLNNDNGLYNCLSPKKEVRHSSWSKILSSFKIIKETTNFDYIVYIDSDCIFNNFKISIEEYMLNIKNINDNNLNLNSDIFFMNNQPWNFDLPCAGFFIIKNNEKSIDFLTEWYSDDDNPKFNKTHPWEQITLQFKLIKNENYKIEIINDWMFRPFNNQFLRHIGSEENFNRIPFFKHFINTNFKDSNFVNIISELNSKIVKYNTEKILFT